MALEVTAARLASRVSVVWEIVRSSVCEPATVLPGLDGVSQRVGAFWQGSGASDDAPGRTHDAARAFEQ